MQANKAWDKLFNQEHFKEHYYEKVSTKTSVGLDKITVKKFETLLDENIEIICKKTKNNTYKFTRYKQLLFLKGPNKKPRAVSVPTVRDKLTLSVLNELITEVYGDSCKAMLPQLIINDISSSICDFDSFIKLDISSFYSSINQEKLLSILKRKIKKEEILNLITGAIQTDSLIYPIKEKTQWKKRTEGVPEGLPISNALANIYLLQLDDKYKSINNIKYWRYVDDILILLNHKDIEYISKMIHEDIKKLDLSFNEKEAEGKIQDGFEYLGYRITNEKITVRRSSVLKFEQSIEDLLRMANKDNFKYIEWKLNNKISGFVLNNKKYGWVFFYSQINDEHLLFHLDKLMLTLLKRYKLDKKVNCKRFVRTFYEITKSLHTTKYIPNFDKFGINEKREVLRQIYGIKMDSWNDEEIEFKFRMVMANEIRNIERDIENFS